MTVKSRSRLETSVMVRSILVPVALLFAGASAVAAEPEPRGFYVGGMVGTTTLDDDGLFAGLNFDDSDTGFGFFGGYKILKYLAVEARLSSLGSYSVESENLDLTGISAHVIGIIPFGNSGWELFGQLGIGSVNIESDCCGDDDSSVGSAGIGVRFYATPNMGISLQMDAYAYEEDDFFGSTYDVGVVATQIGFHYLF